MTQERRTVTVGVTKKGAEHLEHLMSTGWFESEMAAYLVAIGTALARGLAPGPAALPGVTTKWNVGSLDPDRRLLDLMRLLGPSGLADEYDHAERLADAGLEFLRQRLDGGALLSDLIGPVSAETSPQDRQISEPPPLA